MVREVKEKLDLDASAVALIGALSLRAQEQVILAYRAGGWRDCANEELGGISAIALEKLRAGISGPGWRCATGCWRGRERPRQRPSAWIHQSVGQGGGQVSAERRVVGEQSVAGFPVFGIQPFDEGEQGAQGAGLLRQRQLHVGRDGDLAEDFPSIGRRGRPASAT